MPKIVTPGGLTVHFQQLGEGQDVILLHGLTGNLAVWHFQILPRLWRDFRCLTYDLRGHGYTQMTPTGYSCTQLAADLLGLMDALSIERADLVGHSLGADVALYFACLYPDRVRRMVLIEPMVPALVYSPTRLGARAGPEGEYRSPPGLLSWFGGLVVKAGVPLPKPEEIERDALIRFILRYPNQWGPMKDLPTAWSEEAAFRLLKETTLVQDLAEIGVLTRKRIREIRTPTHLVCDHASRIWRRSYNSLKRLLPNVTHTMVKTDSRDKAHFMPMENSALVAEQIVLALGVEDRPGYHVGR